MHVVCVLSVFVHVNVCACTWYVLYAKQNQPGTVEKGRGQAK